MASPKDRFRQAVAHFEAKRLREAETICKSIHAKTPRFLGAVQMLGIIAAQTGRFQDAEKYFRKAIAFDRKAAPIWANLGRAQAAQGKAKEAAESLRQAVTLDAKLVQAHANLAEVLWQLRDFEGVLSASRTVAEITPQSPSAQAALGRIEAELGHYDAAAAAFRRALQLDPRRVEAAAGLAAVLEGKGEFDDADEIIMPHLERGTENVTIHMVEARLAGRLDRREVSMKRLQAWLQRNAAAPPDQRAHMLYALAKHCDARTEYDQAFAFAKQANLARGAAEEADVGIPGGRLLPAATTSAEALATLPRSTHRSKRPIFIVGMPRSGTSLVEQILAAHPAVFGGGEPTELGMLLGDLQQRLSPRLSLKEIPQEEIVPRLDEVAIAYDQYLQKLGDGAERVTDKLPSNFLYLGLIELLFPESKIVHCRRHPLDTCVSCFFEDFGARHHYTRALEPLGRACRSYHDTMQQWRSVITMPILELGYEALIDDQEGMTRKLLDFCELDWHDACLRFHQQKRVVRTLSYDQVRQPIYRRSVGRYRNYQKHLDPLIEAIGPDVPSEPADE